MPLSIFPTMAIPSYGALALFSVAKKRAEGVPVFIYQAKTMAWFYAWPGSKKCCNAAETPALFSA
ncbi:hypothetical protein ACIOVF_00095 [Pseudomonas sp. NPDC087612]|nr:MULTISPECIES: hypothetical protein [unclassified Pseudomonas]QPG62139.1 hypothetical protein HFV04_021820 [Pseudomonas sp. BIGb0427]UVM53559.1 hypothetical protein LOY37_14350 [Pseudomonas sp. B21-012]UVM64477.1 hypothetical protein LOY34_14060 [Pseudomonas sp. B21-009]